MPLSVKIAWRNLWRHRSHSLVIGSILCLGALLMTVGNGVVSGMERGLQSTVVRGFTGDLVLVPETHEGDNVFLEMMGKALEPLSNFRAIEPVLASSPLVDRFLPMGKNMAMVLNEDGGMPVFIYLLGVDFERYALMFPDNVRIIEGRFPAAGGPGLLLPTGARKDFNLQTDVWFIPEGAALDTAHLEPEDRARPQELRLKSDMVLMGFNEGNSSTDIRIDVDGIFKYRALNTIFGHFALIDIESYRQALGYFLASETQAVEVSVRDSALFAADEDLDAFFSGETVVAAQDAAQGMAQGSAQNAPPAAVSKAASDGKAAADLNEGAYNVVLVQLPEDADPEKAKAELNGELKRNGLGVRAVSWRDALGPVGSMTALIKAALFVFVGLLFVVAVIIIVNTLSMAALERMSEIGMMRAVGAQKGFIARMFLAETAALAAVFGGLGILLGAAAVQVLAWFEFTSQNDMVQLFFGGDTFRPLLAASDFALTALQLIFVTVAAVAYPLYLTRSITPLDAVNKE